MNIIIKRHQKSPDYIVGHLLIDGEHICHTLENPNSCLPAGSYPVTIVKCKVYNRKMPLLFPHPSPLTPHPNCSKCKKPEFVGINTTIRQFCPMLKPGNGVHNRLDGSVLVGDCEVPGCILHPRTTFDSLYQRIRKSIERGNQVVLTIKNEFV